MKWIKNSSIKDGEIIEFQPTKMEGKEHFALWNIKDKHWIQEGAIIVTDKGDQQVNRYISLNDEEKKLFRRNLKFNREVIVNGERTMMALGVETEKALRTQMAVVKTLGKEPLSFTYLLKREGTELKTKWGIALGKEAGLPDGVRSERIITINLELTEMEKAYVKALKDYDTYPEAKNYTNADRVLVFVQKLEMDEDRAKRIVSENF